MSEHVIVQFSDRVEIQKGDGTTLATIRDGEVFEVETATLGTIKDASSGTTHAPDDIGSHGGPYSTDTSTAGENVIVADTAPDVQDAIDTLSGDGDGGDPGGGAVLLKRKSYEPSSPIELKTGVELRGIQPDRREGKNNHEWQYSRISGANLSGGTPVVTTVGSDSTPDRARHCGIANLVIDGTGNDVVGFKVDNAGNTWMRSCIINDTTDNAYWVRGGLDTYVWSSVCNSSNTDGNATVLIESQNDDLGGGSNDTQIWWRGGGRIKAGENTALRFESSLAYLHIDKIAKSVNPPSTTNIVDHDGSELNIYDANIDGFRNGNNNGIGGRNNGKLIVRGATIQKCAVGVEGAFNQRSRIEDTQVVDCTDHGIVFAQSGHALSNVTVIGCRNDGIRIDSTNVNSPWTQVKCVNNGTGINMTGAKGGTPGDVPVVWGYHGDPVSGTAVVDGQVVNPATHSLGGSDGSVSVMDPSAAARAGAIVVRSRVAAGGSAATLRGIDGPTYDGQAVRLEHAGEKEVTLAHRDGNAANPLANRSGFDETLSANGDLAEYVYSETRGEWVQTYGVV